MFLKNKIFKILIIILSTSSVFSETNWWGEHCTVRPLPKTKFCIFCNYEGGEWTKWNIDPEFDDKLKKKGWKPKQVVLAMNLFLRHQIQSAGIIPVNTR